MYHKPKRRTQNYTTPRRKEEKTFVTLGLEKIS